MMRDYGDDGTPDGLKPTIHSSYQRKIDINHLYSSSEETAEDQEESAEEDEDEYPIGFPVDYRTDTPGDYDE